MFVRTLEIAGFMPYRDKFRLSFRNGQIIGITGQYGNDFSRSNRAGKSSFVDAQIWCLYGESRAKREIEIIHNEADFAQVSVELYDPTTDTATWVTRSRDKDNKGSLEITGAEGEKKKVGQEIVNKLVGMSYEEFAFTAFFKQNDIDQFMQADSQKKKEILMKWIQKVKWEDFQEKANKFKIELMRDKDRIETLIAALPDGDFDETVLLQEAADLKKDNDELKIQVDGLAKKRIDLNLKIKDLKSVDEKRNRAAELASKIQQLKNRRPDSSQQRDALAKLTDLLGKYEIVTPDKYKEIQDKRDKFVSAIANANAEINDFERQIRSAGKEMTGVCPILKQACSRIEPDPDHLNGLKSAIAGTRKKVERYQENQEKANKMIALYQKQNEWRQQKEKVELQIKASQQLESQIADLSNQRAEVLKSIPQDAEEQISKANHKLAAIAGEQETLQTKIMQNDKRMGQITEIIKQYKEAKERKQSLDHQLKNIEVQLADAQYVEYMFGKNGIPSMELENSYNEIEEDANTILKKLKAPFHMEFEATRELKDWEPNCLACGTPFEKGEKTHKCKACGTDREKKRRDELSLKVFEGGVERQFYMDSGGGKVLLSVAMRLALTMLARRRKGASWGTIYLDEVFGSLDATNRRILSDLITSVLMKELGFEQVFVISHDQNIQTAFEDQIIVKRYPEKGYSELFM